MTYDDWKTSPPDDKEYDEDLYYEALGDVVNDLFSEKPSDLLEYPEIFRVLKAALHGHAVERLKAQEREERAWAHKRNRGLEEYT